MGIEIELKYHLQNSKEISFLLNKVAKKEKIKEFQTDLYYKVTKGVFRIRKTKNGYFLTKIQRKERYASKYSSRKISVSELKEVKEKLGAPFATIKKIRSTWIFQDVEFALDKVENKGIFLEIEALENKETINATVKYLKNHVSKLGIPVGKIINKSYSSI